MGRADEKEGKGMSEVLENKNAPGNGLTDVVAPEESDPLRGDEGKKDKSKGLKGVLKKGGNRNKDKEKVKMTDYSKRSSGSGDVTDGRRVGVDPGLLDPEDPGPSVSDNESFDGENNKKKRKDRKDTLGSWAHKCRLTPKRGLIYLLFCSCLIFLLLLVLIILASLWPSGPQREACQTAKCHLFASKILEGVNSSIKPCDDIWEFSCGGWLQANPLPKSRGYWDVQALEELKAKESLRTILNTLPASVTEEANSVPLKMKMFYDSCMGLEYIETDGDKGLSKLIKKLGGWNVLRDFQAKNFEFPRTLRKLHKEHRTSPFFHVEVVPDPRVPTRNIIKISPSGLSLPHRSYYFGPANEQSGPMADAFQVFAKDVVQLLGATSYQGSQFAVEIFNFEKRIAEVTPDPSDLSDPLVTFHKVTLSDLKAMSNTIFWDDFLKFMFPQGNINDNTEILTPVVQYLIDISSIISSTDKGNLNNYLMWHLTLKYLPYLSRHFTEVYEMYRKDTIGSSYSVPRWEFCTSESMKFFPHGTDFLFLKNSDEHRHTRVAKVDSMFETMRQTLSYRINSASKFDETTRNFLLDKIRLMSIEIGTPVQNNTLLKELYLSVDMQKLEFFANVETLIDFQSRGMQKDLAQPNKMISSSTTILNAMANNPFKIQFIPSMNKVIVPEGVLQNQILDVDDTLLPMVFGSIGVQLAQALASSFGPDQGLYSSQGVLLSERDPKAEALRSIVDSRRTCISSFFSKIKLDDEDYVERTSLDSTIHLAGIQIALETLKTHDASETFLGLPGLEYYSPEGLFFVAYGQSQCSVHTMLYHELEHTTFPYFSHEHRVKGALRQLVGFTEALECSKSSWMYADFTCDKVI